MRHTLPAVGFLLGLLALFSSPSSAFEHDHRHDDPALRAIEAAQRQGVLEADEALLLAVQRIFEPDALPLPYRAEGAPPIRCATPILEAARTFAFDPSDRARVDAWMAPSAPTLARRVVYTTPEGRFQIDYETSGTNQVPSEDVAPANGIPDLVEKIGGYFEESWDHEFAELGFTAPDLSGGPYRILMRRIGAYGFTERTDEGTAGTQITVHHNFLNFPPNEDPEGTQLGAAKVTCAHELKHASQFTNNGWTEPGLWIEIDATWTEDIVYDQVNDYYNYITFRSPITDPPRPLDDGGSGAYAEAIWQHWMSESRGIGTVLAFWNRRAAAPQEAVMASYDLALRQFGAPLADSWVEFASWNYASGANAISGFGYEEASAYPTPPDTDADDQIPASFSGAVERLAAHFLRVSGFTRDETGVVTITPQLPTSSPLRARAIVIRRGAVPVVEEVVLQSGLTSELATPLESVNDVVLVLGHGDLAQGAAVYEITVGEEIRRPAPTPLFDVDAVRVRVAAGESTVRGVGFENVGEAGSVLDYEAVLVPADVTIGRATIDAPAPSISGSGITFSTESYDPATTTTLQIEVANRSVDFEWLKSISINFPPGVIVEGADDFLAPEDRRLVSDGSTGDGTTVTWTDPDGAWGNVRNGETAVARVDVHFGLELHGDLVVPYTLVGDGFGTGESTVEGAVLLDGPNSPLVEIDAVSRVVRTGDREMIVWTAAVDGDVAIDLSRDGGATWEVLTAATTNDGTWTWNVTGPTTFEAHMRVRDVDDPTTVGSTDTAFVVAETLPWANVINPQGKIDEGERDEIQLAFDTDGLSAGVYDAVLAVVYDGMDTPALLDVELDVRNDGTAADVPLVRGVVHGARPNPFNPVTHVAFTLNRASQVRIDVYTQNGRHIRTLVDERLAAGEHAVPWTGRDARDHRVASGVYLYAVELEGERTLGKVALVE